MNISTLSMEQFTENSVLCHIQSIHFKPVVATVLKNHTMFASLLNQVDKIPALFNIHSRRYFNSRILSILHSKLSHGEMVIPVSCNINKINIGAFAKFLITFCTKIDGRWRKICFFKIFLATFCALLFIVAQCNNFYTRNICPACNSTRSTHS